MDVINYIQANLSHINKQYEFKNNLEKNLINTFTIDILYNISSFLHNYDIFFEELIDYCNDTNIIQHISIAYRLLDFYKDQYESDLYFEEQYNEYINDYF